MELLTWIGIAVCVSQSALFSGLNLAFFSLSRMRLEVEVAAGNPNAVKVLALRRDPNLLLTTVLVGNVAVNVLLTLLSDSVLTGVSAFLFSTVVITALGEIVPQAYFSRNALRVTSFLSPVFRFYRALLYPVTKPVAMLLDRWLGKEGLAFLREREMRHLIAKHIEAGEAEIDRIEGMGALNFLAIDDMSVKQHGMTLNPDSVIELSFDGLVPQFPRYKPSRRDPFLKSVQASGEKWVVLVDPESTPRLVMDADGFLREALFSRERIDPMPYCHRPIIVTDPAEQMGSILSRWQTSGRTGETVIDKDLVLVWDEQAPRVITGADVLGRLLQGIAGRAFRLEAGAAAEPVFPA